MLIFLIGYMGAGKTTLGLELARKLGYPFVDMDAMLVQEQQKTVSALFLSFGEPAFRKMEAALLRRLLAMTNAVIATGGGAPCHSGNMDAMNRAGATVYLEVAPEVLYERLKADHISRPLLKSISPDNLQNFIREHLTERERYYHLARVIFDPGTSGIDELVALLI